MGLEPPEILESVSPSGVTVTLLILYSVSLKILLWYLKVTETSGPNISCLFLCVYHSTTRTLCPLADPGLDIYSITPQTHRDVNVLDDDFHLFILSVLVREAAFPFECFFNGIRYKQTVWDRMNFWIIQFSECTRNCFLMLSWACVPKQHQKPTAFWAIERHLDE